MELRLEHGACPDNAKYSYVVIPYATEEKLNKYYEDPDVQIISNTRSIAAVKEKRIGVTGFMFYEPGECEGVSVDKPCIITASKDQDTFCFAVSDPTQKLTEINITLDFASEPLFLDEGVTTCSCVEKTKIKINCDGSLGRPINVKLKI